MSDTAVINADSQLTIIKIPKIDIMELGVPNYEIIKSVKVLDLISSMFEVSKSDIRRDARKLSIGGSEYDLEDIIERGNIACVVLFGKERGIVFNGANLTIVNAGLDNG